MAILFSRTPSAARFSLCADAGDPVCLLSGKAPACRSSRWDIFCWAGSAPGARWHGAGTRTCPRFADGFYLRHYGNHQRVIFILTPPLAGPVRAYDPMIVYPLAIGLIAVSILVSYFSPTKGEPCLRSFHLHWGPHKRTPIWLPISETKDAAVIDPSWDGHVILEAAQKRGWRIAHLWYTHAHFDHIGGAGAIADALNPLPLVALHPNDHVLWRSGGGGAMFGFDIDPGPEPTIDFYTGTDPETRKRGIRSPLHAGAYDRVTVFCTSPHLACASAATSSLPAPSAAPISPAAAGSSLKEHPRPGVYPAR
jgi:hypothetical protein